MENETKIAKTLSHVSATYYANPRWAKIQIGNSSAIAEFQNKFYSEKVDDKLKAEVVGLSDLKEGENPGTIVPLTFLVPISGQGKIPPVLLIMADKDQNCVCLAMYKVGYDRLDFFNSKHVYHVMHPVYKTIELDLGGEAGKVTFPCIQLDHPRSLARDGTRLSDFYSHEFTTNQMKG